MILEDKIDHHWRVFFEDNIGEVNDEKSILHAKRWDVYMVKLPVYTPYITFKELQGLWCDFIGLKFSSQ